MNARLSSSSPCPHAPSREGGVEMAVGSDVNRPAGAERRPPPRPAPPGPPPGRGYGGPARPPRRPPGRGPGVTQAEPPGGDPLRQLTPFGRKEYMAKDKARGEPVGLHFLHEMRNKYSITLDLGKPAGRDILKKLANQLDVILENAPPGQWDRWGIGYRRPPQ